jgi:hypothetical protein
MIAVYVTTNRIPSAAREALEAQGCSIHHLSMIPSASGDLLYYASEAAGQFLPDVLVINDEMPFDVLAGFLRDESITVVTWNGEIFEQVTGITTIVKAWHPGRIDEAPAWHAGQTEAERTRLIYQKRSEIMGKEKAGKATYARPRAAAKRRAARQDEE